MHSPINAIDAYKLDHRRQYPPNTTNVYSNFTPRTSRVDGVSKVVFFGLQAFLVDYCENQFGKWFAEDKDKCVSDYKKMVDSVLGPNNVGTEHIAALHDLGYLPLAFCALPEGTLCPLRVPMFTVENTLPEFFWLVNYIESVLSAKVWLPCTSATNAYHLRKLLDARAEASSSVPDFVSWQGHDFSFRGMENVEAAAASGAGHLLSFTGSDTIPAIEYVNGYYPGDNGLIAGSVAATEHSVMCAGGQADELETFERLLDLYPTGILSVVSDTWDLWKVCTEYLPKLKDKILAREGKLVIRPDSGDPVDIICGDKDAPQYSPQWRGVAALLFDTFGGTKNNKGYYELDNHIGMIYGDSINYIRAEEMTQKLMQSGFASTNIVLGVGSYTYQFVTRDTFGFAMKATSAVVDGIQRALFKDPVTDDGTKRSAKGRLSVQRDLLGELHVISEATPKEEANSKLRLVWINGAFVHKQSFAEVRAALKTQ